MKKIILLAIVFVGCLQFNIFSANAQTLYGTTSKGGDEGGGTINKFVPATNNLTVLKSFEMLAAKPWGSFIQASDGKLYGMTSVYGMTSEEEIGGFGVIFSYDPSSSTYTNLKEFDGTNGSSPSGSLMQANDGKLYGMTFTGGSNGFGVIFSFDPSSSTYTKLKDFDYTNGGHPHGSLIQASDGKLYGMTLRGGQSDYGVIFSFDPSSSTYTKLQDFDNTNGGYPNGSLMQASDGKLYGMTPQGGSNSAGVIFSFDLSSSTFTKLKDFDDTDGSHPYGSLIQASDGKLYGMTTYGGSSGAGVIFSFDPSTSIYIETKDFDFDNGGLPYGSLMQASDGLLYGMTSTGGSRDDGVAFSFDPISSTCTKLNDFDGANGRNPYGGLIQANDGNLYGMTYSGGALNSGVIFSYNPTSSTHTKLKDFGANESGSNVSASLMQASDGKLYGTTTYGGSSGYGVIFSFDPSTSTYTKLWDFDFTNGRNPYGSLIQASDGKLYGIALSGYGVIFSFDPASSTYTKLIDFDGTNGSRPEGSLKQASDGKLYGMTQSGGSSGYGVIFSFDPAFSTYTKLKDFDGTNGAKPIGTFMQSSDGKLYGMTSEGGSSGYGVIFSYDPSSSIYTKLQDYTGANGAYPSNGSAFIEIREPNKTVVSSFTLVNADADDDIQSIPDGSILDINTLPRYVNIRANTNPNKVGSVVFILDGKKVRTENGVPYALAGDNPSGDYHNWTLPLGDHTLTAIPYSKYNGKGTEGTALTIHFTVVGQRVASFTLINADTDKGIQSIADGAIIDLNKLPTHQLNIRANTNPGKVGSVVFILDGKKVRTENGAPYALAGDFPSGDYHAWALPLGNHTLTAIPYSNYNGKGTEGVSLTIHFTVVNNQANLITMANRLDIPTEVMDFSLYPNPVNKILNINIGDIQPNGKSTVSIINSSGAVVRTIQVNGRNNIMQLHVSSLAPGTYFIKIINGDKVMNRRFVKL